MSKRTSLFGDAIQYNNKVIGIMFAILCVLVGAFYLFFYKGNSGTTTTKFHYIAILGSDNLLYYSPITIDDPTKVSSWIPVNISITSGKLMDLSISNDKSIAVVSGTGSIVYSEFISGTPWVLVDQNANAIKVNFMNGVIYAIDKDNSKLYTYTKNVSGSTITWTKSTSNLTGPPGSNDLFQSISVNPNGGMFASVPSGTGGFFLFYKQFGGNWGPRLSGGGTDVSSNNNIMCMLGDQNNDTIYCYFLSNSSWSSGPQIFHPNQAGGRRWKYVAVNPGYVTSVLACDDQKGVFYCPDITATSIVWQQYDRTVTIANKAVIAHP